EPVAAEPVAVAPETVKPVEISAEQWAIEAAKLFEPPIPSLQGPATQGAQSTAAKPAFQEPAIQEVVGEPVEDANFFSRFRKDVSATRENIATRIEDAVKGKKQIDESTLEELEEALIGADIGVQTTLEIIEDVRRQVNRQSLKDVAELK